MRRAFTRADLDAAYGAGRWRASRRFPTWQKQQGKCRPCDDCAESGHNICSSLAELLKCDSADYPAMAAALYATYAASPSDQILDLVGGVNDIIEAVYRRVCSAYPQFGAVCAIDPLTGEPMFFTMGGLNSGLATAPVLFSRVPRLVVQLLRRVLGVAVTHFYDGFYTCEPRFAAANQATSGQTLLWRAMVMAGLPLALEKHVPASPAFFFLGVRADGVRHTRSHPRTVRLDSGCVGVCTSQHR
jgi:hypothetical protein